MYYDGAKIQNAIAKRKQSVADFAAGANLSRLSVYRAMCGGKASTRTLGKLAATLNVEPISLLTAPMKEASLE